MTYKETILRQVAEGGYQSLVYLIDNLSYEILLDIYGPRETAEDWDDVKHADPFYDEDDN